MINTDVLSCTVSKLSQSIDKFWTHCVFSFLWGAKYGQIGATYDVYLRLIGKRVVDTAEALLSNVD